MVLTYPPGLHWSTNWPTETDFGLVMLGIVRRWAHPPTNVNFLLYSIPITTFSYVHYPIIIFLKLDGNEED